MTELTAQQQGTELATIGLDEFGAPPVSSQDILIPKILLMQKMSKKLDQPDTELREGDLIDSLTDEKIGGIKAPLEILPFFMEKAWFRSVKKGGDWELLNIEDVTADNDNLRYSEVKNGEEYKNEMHMRFYCLRLDDTTLPYVLTFKGMSLKAGKLLATQMYIKNRAAGLNPAGMTVTISVNKETNDKGSYCVLAPKASRRSTGEEQKLALDWYRTITTSKQAIRQTEMKAQDVEAEMPNAVAHEESGSSDF